MIPVRQGNIEPPKNNKSHRQPTNASKLFRKGIGAADPRHIIDTANVSNSADFEL